MTNDYVHTNSHQLLSHLVSVLSADEHDHQVLTWSAEADTPVELAYCDHQQVTAWPCEAETPEDYLRLQLDVLQRGDPPKNLGEYDGPDVLSIARYLRLLYVFQSCWQRHAIGTYRQRVYDVYVDLFLLIHINPDRWIGIKTRLVES